MAERSLKLTRPLVVFDLETTGLDVERDRIVEISCVKLMPAGDRQVRTRRLNPGLPIAASATEVHGISDADVKDEPTFAKVARSLYEFLSGADLAGFNIEHFDLPLLVAEFARVGLVFPSAPASVIDAWRIFLMKEPRDLSAAFRFYCGKDLDHAHAAEADAMAAADVLAAQIRRYGDLPETPPELHEACHPIHPDWLDPEGKIVWRDNDAVFAFGRYRDRPLRTLAAESPDYLRWVSGANFSPEVRRIAEAALRGEFP
ncbi:MAG: 3'-5' exonuclease, partial [Deltaproteobacteria bacterium]|nr:3'-5' exonuclease [Deltaproteobacteria bacterium]